MHSVVDLWGSRHYTWNSAQPDFIMHYVAHSVPQSASCCGCRKFPAFVAKVEKQFADLVMSAKQVSPVLSGNPVFCLFCAFLQ